jgi:hypothetical protein
LWKSRCVAIGSLGFDLVDHIKRGMVKADSLLSAFGTLTYWTIGKIKLGKAIFVDSKDGCLQ